MKNRIDRRKISFVESMLAGTVRLTFRRVLLRYSNYLLVALRVFPLAGRLYSHFSGAASLGFEPRLQSES